MRYSVEPRDTINVKGYGFLSFAKNICKTLSSKYGQKLLDVIKTASKRAIQKAAEATSDLIGNKIADKTTSVSTKKAAKNDDANIEIKADVNVPKKRYISPEEKQQIIDELRLVPKKNAYFYKLSMT